MNLCLHSFLILVDMFFWSFDLLMSYFLIEHSSFTKNSRNTPVCMLPSELLVLFLPANRFEFIGLSLNPGQRYNALLLSATTYRRRKIKQYDKKSNAFNDLLEYISTHLGTYTYTHIYIYTDFFFYKVFFMSTYIYIYIYMKKSYKTYNEICFITFLHVFM